MAIEKKTLLGIFFCILAIVARVTYLICAPIWIDYFKVTSIHSINITNSSEGNFTDMTDLFPAKLSYKNTSIMFIILAQWVFTTLIYSIIFFVMKICVPKMMENNAGYSHKALATVGVCQGLSTLLFNYSISGTRTAPYLQALLSNCAIPLQFVISYVVVRQRPSLVKLLCALTVFIAEIICLLPTIFPQLETASEHHTEGGSTGSTARVIWPMIFVFSQVPFTIGNIYLQKAVQQKRVGLEMDSVCDNASCDIRHVQIEDSMTNTKDSPKDGHDIGRIVYFAFWYSVYVTVTVCGLFWIDIIPHFGTSKNMHAFGEIMEFNIHCLIGQEGCTAVYPLVWINLIAVQMAVLAFVGLMMYCEGANFAMIVLAFRTPIAFLFWTLFQEEPFMWHPHIALSTWLSIGAIFVMFPAVIIYNIGWPWCHRSEQQHKEDTRGLLENNRNEDTID